MADVIPDVNLDGRETTALQHSLYEQFISACLGSYGDNCSNSCTWNCRGNATCNNENGHCSNGCKPGYDFSKDPLCSTACDGSYGDKCSKACTWNCRGNETCNNENGHCSNGCKPGYNFTKDPLCTTECSGYFGNNCSSRCHCRNDSETCNILDGHCTSGCAEGWGGNNCSIDHNILLAGIYNPTATQSSTYRSCDASRIIDGVLWTYDTNNCSKCSATNGQDVPWAQIALNRQIVGSSVRIFGRSDPAQQSQYLSVYIRNDTRADGNEILIGIINDTSSEIGELIHLKNRTFRYLVVEKSTTSVMAICEIKLYKAECQDGNFGDMCALECHCFDGKPCDTVTGQCNSPGCFAGWQGEACNRSFVVMESLLHYLLEEKVEQDGREQTCLTDAHWCPEEVLLLFVENGVFVEFLNDMHQPYVNVESSHNKS
ncbi:protein draper-like [Dreissena polymorpha]|uniref:protein draper-like n=1 Tax=Dreissena polymorpha TaxID=45954 RepID=UPI002264A90A|nr:protein draper-like [Dreissena polymorpha]